MSRPKVLQRLRALGGLQLGDAEAPEDVKSTLFIIQLFEDGVKAIAEDIGLQKLLSTGCAEQEPGTPGANVLSDYRR